MVLAAIVCFTATACDASVSYFYDSDGENAKYYFEISVTSSLKRTLEQTAADRTGDIKWTIKSWLDILMKSFEYVPEETKTSGNSESYGYCKEVPLSEIDKDDDDKDENYSEKKKNLFFFTETVVTISNPFNSARKDYDGAVKNDSDGYGIYEVIKYGAAPFPSFFEAFPAAKNVGVDNLVLNFYLPKDGLLSSSGTGVTLDGKEYFRFDRVFDDSELTITYSYLTVNSLGWYVTAILAGAAIAALVLWSTHAKRSRLDYLRDMEVLARSSNTEFDYGFHASAAHEDIDPFGLKEETRGEDEKQDTDPSELDKINDNEN